MACDSDPYEEDVPEAFVAGDDDGWPVWSIPGVRGLAEPLEQAARATASGKRKVKAATANGWHRTVHSMG